MKRFVRMGLCLVVGVATVAGCSTVPDYFAGDDNEVPPSELVDFPARIEIETAWAHDVGAGPDDIYLKLRPALGGDRIFAASRKGRVSSYDAESGDRLWETKLKLPVSGGPGIGAGVVVVGSTDGDVVALSPENGEVLWKVLVTSEVLAAPRAAEGVVVIYSVDGKVHGLSADNGETLWTYDRGVPALTLRGASTPALAPGVAVVGFDSGRVVALSLDGGQPLWETRVALPSGRSELERMVDIDGDLLIADNTVYVVTFQGRAAALDLDTGAILWRRDMSSHEGMGLDDQALYVTDDRSHVWALDRDSSSSIWKQDRLEGRALTAPASFDQYVIVGDFDGYVHWLSREDGQFAARTRVDGSGIITAPVVAGDLVYVFGRSGKLAALRVK